MEHFYKSAATSVGLGLDVAKLIVFISESGEKIP
jgi:hypothetical protein